MGEDLEPARVGEDGAAPLHEPVEPSELLDRARAGAHLEMVGVREHDLGAERLDDAREQALDRALGADRHEDGRADVAVRRVEDAGAGMGRGVLG